MRLRRNVIMQEAYLPTDRLQAFISVEGTPTALNEKYLKELMDIIKADFCMENTLEFCVEAGRPDSIMSKSY